MELNIVHTSMTYVFCRRRINSMIVQYAFVILINMKKYHWVVICYVFNEVLDEH